MSVVEELVARNARYAAERFGPGLRMMPSMRTIVIGCVDPRVDPELVLGLEPGEAAVMRNVGGRVTSEVLDQLVMLRRVTQAAGGDLGAGWEIVVLHHTDCGITRLEHDPSSLADYLGTPVADLPGRAVSDPRAAAVGDVALVRDEARLGSGLRVSGAVYDVGTGRVDVVVP